MEEVKERTLARRKEEEEKCEEISLEARIEKKEPCLLWICICIYLLRKCVTIDHVHVDGWPDV